MKNSELQLLTEFLTYIKDQGSHTRFDIVEGCVLDFLEEEHGMDMRFVNGKIENK